MALSESIHSEIFRARMQEIFTGNVFLGLARLAVTGILDYSAAFYDEASESGGLRSELQLLDQFLKKGIKGHRVVVDPQRSDKVYTRLTLADPARADGSGLRLSIGNRRLVEVDDPVQVTSIQMRQVTFDRSTKPTFMSGVELILEGNRPLAQIVTKKYAKPNIEPFPLLAIPQIRSNGEFIRKVSQNSQQLQHSIAELISA